MKRIYNEIANRYDTTPAEVEREIAYALDLAKRNPSPAAKAFWGRTNEDADVADIISNIVSEVAITMWCSTNKVG